MPYGLLATAAAGGSRRRGLIEREGPELGRSFRTEHAETNIVTRARRWHLRNTTSLQNGEKSVIGACIGQPPRGFFTTRGGWAGGWGGARQ